MSQEWISHMNLDKRPHNKYGLCKCGSPLTPVRFIEKEYVHGVFTGRTRISVSHLLCEDYGRSYTVDDSFDSEWRYCK